MNIIKVNYNNAYVKLPKEISPSLKFYVGTKDGEKCLFLNFVDNLSGEPLYTKYHFDIYINNILVAYVTEESQKHYEIESEVIEDNKKIRIDVKGYYFNDNGLKHDIGVLYFIISTSPICSESLVCSENIYVESELVNV